MATAADIIQGALLKIGVTPIGQEVDANQASHALDELNDMLHGFAAADADLTHTTLAMQDTFALDDEFIGPVKDLLADRVAPVYQTAHPHRADVVRGRARLMAAYQTLTAMEVDGAALNLPSVNWRDNRHR